MEIPLEHVVGERVDEGIVFSHYNKNDPPRKLALTTQNGVNINSGEADIDSDYLDLSTWTMLNDPYEIRGFSHSCQGILMVIAFEKFDLGARESPSMCMLLQMQG